MDGLKKKRKERGLTLKEASDGLGISIQTLSHYERGERFPGKEILERLAKFFECSIDDLM